MNGSKLLVLCACAVMALGMTGVRAEDNVNQNASCAPNQEQGKCDAKHKRFEKIKEKFDTNKDGKLDDSERAAMKDAFKKRREEHRAKMLAEFDKNKDGKLDASERAEAKKVMKERREKRHQEGANASQGAATTTPATTTPPAQQ